MPITKNTVTILPDQTSVDIAMQEAGELESLFVFANLNNRSITDELLAGDEFKKPGIIDKEIVKTFSGLNKPASAIKINIRPGGIGFMQIGNDFIVS